MKFVSCMCWVATAPMLFAQGGSSAYDFGRVRPDAEIQHIFTFKNEGAAPLEIDRVQMTPPLIVTKMTGRVAPGAEGSLTVLMEKPYPKGAFEGAVVVHFKGGERNPQEFSFSGQIISPIEFVPFSAVFISTQRGQPKSASVEIVNNEPEPLEIAEPQCSSARYTCELRTIQTGRRYELTVTLKGDGPGPEQIDSIILPTSSLEHRFLSIQAHTKIRDRVYSFPESVNFETIDANYLKNRPQMVGFLAQSITVYQAAGTRLQAFPETDVPFLKLTTVSSPEFPDRVEIRATVDPTQLRSGQIKGSITVRTNDPDVPKLVIPIAGRIEGNW